MAKKTSLLAEELNVENLFILDEETSFLSDKTDKKKCKTITSLSEFNSLLDCGFQAKSIVIFVELDWRNSSSQFYGYQVARELMSSPNRLSTFNLLFISFFKRETIFKIFKDKNRIFTQKFKHEWIRTEFDLSTVYIPQISVRKFEYLKNYCLLESGILDRLIHDIERLFRNPDDENLKKTIEELVANRDILTQEIISTAEILLYARDFESRKGLLREISDTLKILRNQINNPGESSAKKSHAKVLLVEDDACTMSKLQEQLSWYFHNIEPFTNGSKAFNELEQNAHQYDVVITDMELLFNNLDDEKQGIDILELCENKYPFIVTRVITSLPKNALKQLIGKGLGEIIFKNGTGDSVIPPFENLVDFAKQIDNEVQKKKMLRSRPGPKGSWWGTYLTKELYITKVENREAFNAIWNNAIITANRFINGEFDSLPEKEKVGTSFKRGNDPSSNPSSGWEIIELLLTHRLIALSFASKKGWNSFYFWGEGSNDVYVKLKGFQQGMESKASKAYFQTVLGFSAEGTNPKSYQTVPCKILPINLFPEEYNWLSTINSRNIESLLLREINDDFQGLFIHFMKVYIGEDISEEITFGEAMHLLDGFIEKYPDEKRDKAKQEKLKYIFSKDMDDMYDLLPTETKICIDKIRQDIFPE